MFLILDNLIRFSDKIDNKKKVITSFNDDYYINSDNYLISIIFSNLISNAIKYSNNETDLTIKLFEDKQFHFIFFVR